MFLPLKSNLLWCLMALLLVTMGAQKVQAQIKKEFVPPTHDFAAWLNSMPFYECKIKPELTGKHPRIFFTAGDTARIRRNAQGPNAGFRKEMHADWDELWKQVVPQDLEQMKRSHGEALFAWGWWRLMGLNLMYITEQNTWYRDKAREWVLTFCTYEHWGFNSNIDELGCSDMFAGVAATYDILYNDFTPTERATIRKAIMKNMDVLYTKSFLLNGRGMYWQRDFQNNHHWNRIHALLIGSAAILGDDPACDSKPYLDYAYSQARELLRWLPEDGTCHEGPGYWAFGHKWLIRTYDVINRLTGENYFQQNPYFRNTMYFKMYLTTSNARNSLYFGDGGAGLGGGLYVFYRMADEFKDGQLQFFADRVRQNSPDDFFEHTWGLLWYNAEIKPLEPTALPLGKYYPDMGLFTIRTSWSDDAEVFGIKCGPPGGYLLNELRLAKPGNDQWANVAHDHPDQNSFILYAGGHYWVDDDGYPKEAKKTASHNTLLVDGKGQPNDAMGWYQPFEMEKTGFCRDAWFSGNTGVFVGDATRCYPGLDRFVRATVFVAGEYVVLVDDLAGRDKHDYELRFHNKQQWQEAGKQLFKATAGDQWAHLRVVEPRNVRCALVAEDLKANAKPALSVTVPQAAATRIVTLLAPNHTDENKLKNATALFLDGALTVTCQNAQQRERFVYRTNGTPAVFTGKGVESDGSTMLVRDDSRTGKLTALLATRCTKVTLNGQPYLTAAGAVNYALRLQGDTLTVELDAPTGSATVMVQAKLGGLTPLRAYRLTTAGAAVRPVTAGNDGTVDIALKLDGRQTVVITR
jgi:hypothetical protein